MRDAPLLSRETLAATPALADAFAGAKPFRHLVIDDFLDAAFARQLLAEFPSFESGNARNEGGELGNKSVIERIRGLGPSYAAVDDAIRSPAFLDWLGTVTGIPGLLYDPYYFGGGTHENRDGQDLDPHVDFNRHPVERWHRRLNLIVYLNPEWEDTWGGSLELHSDPRAEDDRVKLVTPLFNRCVVFETNEISWHGFSKIATPPGRAITRRSVALYFYTTTRPAEELADTHSTIYVDRPLPERFTAGHVLSEDDVEHLRVLFGRRDQHNQRLYREVAQLQTRLETANEELGRGPIGRLRMLASRVFARLKQG